ncbi:DUF6615 family protein [Roseiterribacter gracilis]|uniref:DUF6615 family protein n=1 Tax=Roseiterribacter gracilis TaxID=2812848 RepID=UPI003B439BC4
MQLAATVWDTLEHGWSEPARVSETTITDMIVAWLRRYYPDQVDAYKTHNESLVGGDIDMHFVGPAEYFGIRFQAKRLDGQKENLSYPALDSQQCEALQEHASAANLHPLYLFYNWWPGHPADFHAGCTVLDPWFVRDAFLEHEDGDWRRAANFLPKSRPWHNLVCLSGPPISYPDVRPGSPAGVSAVARHLKPRFRAPPGVSDEGHAYIGRLRSAPRSVRSLAESTDAQSEYFERNSVRWTVVVKDMGPNPSSDFESSPAPR